MSAPAVRRALNLAIDRDRLVKVVLGGRGRPASGPLWPQHWALQGADRAYTFDPVEAQAVLDRAGLPRKRQSESDRQQVRFAFTCLIPANFRTEERLALEIQKQLYDVGVDVEFEALPPPEYVKRITSGDFDAVFLEMVGGPTLSRPFLLWRSARRFKGFYNTFGYENGEAEELFDVLQQTTDEDRIRTAARRLQALFLEDPPALFVAWNEQLRAVSRDFRIVQDAGRDPIFTLWRWQSN